MKTGLKLFGLVVGLLAVMMLILGGSVFADTPDETDSQSQYAGYGWNGIKGKGAAGSDTVSDLLGLTADECRALCQEGNSLAEIAAEQGVTVDELVEAIIAEKTAAVQAKVDDGTLTQEQADLLIQQIAEKTQIAIDGTANCPIGLSASDGSGKSASYDSSKVSTRSCCIK
jgi:hypothetical protein